MIKRVKSGIDRVIENPDLLGDYRYGMVTAAHARSLDGVSSRLWLAKHKRLLALFGPEHGLDGVAAAGDAVGNSIDTLTGLPVYSLYQSHSAHDMSTEVIDQIDAFIYDLPDLGTRFYTYIATCLQLIDIAAEHDKKLYILDRPNPLGGEVIEGITLADTHYSFVGPYSLPVRYGLSIGELATLYVAEKEIEIDLEIIQCEGWRRNQLLPETAQIFTVPSPNIPNFEAALLYPGTCLIEGTNLSEGRGTTRPFTWFGAPWIDQEALCAALDKLDHPGIALRPQAFIPLMSKQKDEHCKGIALEVTDPHAVRAHRFMLQAIQVIEQMYPEEFEYYAWGSSRPFMDRLMGQRFTDRLNYDAFIEEEEEAVSAFRERVAAYLIYDV